MSKNRAVLIIELLFAMVFCSPEVKGETVYFLVGELSPYHGDSYVLPLTEPNDIAHARDLIQYGLEAGRAIVVANITGSADYINRDYFSPVKRKWSWHVTQFGYFTNAAPEIWDGWPGAIEQGIMNTGIIGFYTYTVIAELGTDSKHWDRDFVTDDQINCKDYAVLANNWLNLCASPSWCGGTDLDHSGVVDENDLRVFAESWLSPFAAAPTWYSAWNCPTQCHGDADCAAQSGYRVYMADMSIFKSAYGIHYDPRADFDHDGDVDADDQNIINYWYHRTGVPADCPTQP